MSEKIGRNDPCPCGSGKKYKNCCIGKPIKKPLPFKAKLLTPKPVVDLMTRTFGDSIDEASKENKPNLPFLKPSESDQSKPNESA